MVGHAGHFLSRLDRVNGEQVDLALGLYRDPGLVRFLLARVALPEAHERAAISLDDPREGPFLVVTREGHFVTCLGRGMSAGALPVVTREQLEGALTVAGDLRARRAALRERAAAAGGAERLLRGLVDRPDALSREEFVAISAFQPLLAQEFFHRFVGDAIDLSRARERLARVSRPERRLEPVLRDFWRRLWSLGHLLTLATMGERDWLVDLLAKVHEAPEGEALSPSWPLVRSGVAGLALRGAWAMARVGKPLLGFYKGLFATADTPLRLFDAALALGAIGLRHARARAEVRKAAAAAAARVDLDAKAEIHTSADYTAAAAGAYGHVIVELLDAEPGGALDEHALARGRAALSAHVARLPDGERGPFRVPEDVTDDLARAAFLNAFDDTANDVDAAVGCLCGLGTTARARAEDFYFPAEVIPFVRPRWRPELTIELLDRVRRHYGPARPLRVEKKPGRNEPCVCGSGKKFKRCCGA